MRLSKDRITLKLFQLPKKYDLNETSVNHSLFSVFMKRENGSQHSYVGNDASKLILTIN